MNTHINEPKFNDQLIYNLAYTFYCSHETIAKFLGTAAAKKRLNLQHKLKQFCMCPPHPHDESSKSIDISLQQLINQGVDLNFIYNRLSRQKTALMIIVSSPTYCLSLHTVLKKLLHYGANINSKNSHGLTALHLAAEWPIHPLYCKEILRHPNLLINEQNRHGETPLLYCLLKRRYNLISHTCITTLENMLKIGANPFLANKKRLNSLDIAKKLADNRLNTLFAPLLEKEKDQK